MFRWLGRATTYHPLIVIGIWLVLTGIGLGATFGGFGQGGLFDRLAVTAPSTPGTDSEVVDQLTTDDSIGPVTSIVVSGVPLAENTADLVTFMADHRSEFTDIATVSTELDPFLVASDQPMVDLSSPQVQALLSSEQDGFVVVLTEQIGLVDAAAKDSKAAIDEAITAFSAALVEEFPGAQVTAISDALVSDDILTMIQTDLVRGEAIGLPVALVLMMVVFGGLVAAGLPLIGAIVAILLGMAGVWACTFFMDFNSFIMNVLSVIGLALSIDYGLLMVSRFREEIAVELQARRLPRDGSILPDRLNTRLIIRDAVYRTVSTAGRTVFFSALTIACSIAGLLVFDSPILRGITIGGVLVTVLAVLTAITLVPAIISLSGPVLIRPSRVSRIPGINQLTRIVGDSSLDEGFFSKVARWVHRIPWLIIVLIAALLGFMASPLGDLKMRSSFIEYLPADSTALIAYTTLQDEYPALANPEVVVVADVDQQQAADLSDWLGHLEGVTHVIPATVPGDADLTQFGVHLDVADSTGPQVVEVVHQVRDLDPDYDLWVGGDAAQQQDFADSLVDGAPQALAIVAIAVLVLLFLMTGSLAIPLKALVVNSLSLMASLGATVWIFEGGHLGVEATPGLETFIVAIMIAFGFGLSMDYEVFLVARMKEYWDLGLPNDVAVERGLQRSGRIITSAAAIIVAVFVGFISGEMAAIKQIGVALAITVTVDATLVRLLLVPATMEVLGKWNWWAPRPLRWIHDRFGIDH